MLKKLKQRWKVNGINLVLIIFTFALGGSLCAITARKIMALTPIEERFIWLLIYIVLITLLWPFFVLLISIPMGQFVFFKDYLSKVWNNLSGKKSTVPLIAVFASGAGSNAQKIIEYFEARPAAGKVKLIVCSKAGAGVLKIAYQHQIDTILLDKEIFFHSDAYIIELKNRNIQFIVLAGFLWKVPSTLIKAYPNKIINIHPALLPKYGGKGMYGNHVHEAVISARDTESGITIHFVDELYDHGNIIFQANCNIAATDDAKDLANKIHLLEHEHYPVIIERVLKMQNRS